MWYILNQVGDIDIGIEGAGVAARKFPKDTVFDFWPFGVLFLNYMYNRSRLSYVGNLQPISLNGNILNSNHDKKNLFLAQFRA